VTASIFVKDCFGKYKCWNQIKAKCPIVAECRIKRLSEDVKAGLVKVCFGCRGTGLIGTSLCLACHGKGFLEVAKR
jgi:DnaJ-class molecular chaperone